MDKPKQETKKEANANSDKSISKKITKETKAKSDKSEEKKPEVIFVGNKTPMSYVMAVITALSSGANNE